MKRVFIIHGWDGTPDSNWFPWLKNKLEDKGFEVEVPEMPDADTPRIEPWVSKISEVVGKPDEDTYFAGHSIGCPAIARYLEQLPEGVKVGGVVFVAGFFLPLTPPTGVWEDGGETDKHWSSAPIDFESIRTHLDKSVAIFSDSDPWVPINNKDIFEKELGSKIVVEHNSGHLNEGYGFTELPPALDAILELSNT